MSEPLEVQERRILDALRKTHRDILRGEFEDGFATHAMVALWVNRIGEEYGQDKAIALTSSILQLGAPAQMYVGSLQQLYAKNQEQIAEIADGIEFEYDGMRLVAQVVEA